MCGIVGAIRNQDVVPVLIEGLKRLEYRGYDSAGVAILTDDGQVRIARATGKLACLEETLHTSPLSGTVGIGHTRWATHGMPTEWNAHPHRSARVAVVHNGIIENYQELRAELISMGVHFTSETDTEVIPNLIDLEWRQGVSPEEAVLAAVQRLRGAFALGVLFVDRPDLLVATRRGSPLIVGLGEGEQFIASDATALVSHTRRMIYLQDDDVAVLTRQGCRLMDLTGQSVTRPVKFSQVSAELTEKWPYRHYMQKEIFEQPTAIAETLKIFLHPAQRKVEMPEEVLALDLAGVNRVQIIACGTSWHAGLVGQYWIEEMARIPASCDIASEFRYREPPFQPGTLVVAISQSGETADTLAAMRYARSQGCRVLGIVNVPESSIDRESDAVLYTRAGPEIGVASTKAFTTQLTVLACLALAMGKAKGTLSPEREGELLAQLQQLPARVEQVLTHEGALVNVAREFLDARGFLYLGRGTGFPIALEGALKLKEISYIHAEGYPAGEMKHGPIALIDKVLPVVVVAPRDRLFEKVLSNLEEVKARGGRVLLLSTVSSPAEERRISEKADFFLPMVACDPFVAPILYVVPLQMLAYHIAVLKGTDVDQPRNLAKSVTVE